MLRVVVCLLLMLLVDVSPSRLWCAVVCWFVDGWCSVLSLFVLLHADVGVDWCCCTWLSRVLVCYCLLWWCVVCRGVLLIVRCVFVVGCRSLLCIVGVFFGVCVCLGFVVRGLLVGAIRRCCSLVYVCCMLCAIAVVVVWCCVSLLFVVVR